MFQAADVASCTKSGDVTAVRPPRPDSYCATVVMSFARQKYSTTRHVGGYALPNALVNNTLAHVQLQVYMFSTNIIVQVHRVSRYVNFDILLTVRPTNVQFPSYTIYVVLTFPP